jgi:hypothetical protein
MAAVAVVWIAQWIADRVPGVSSHPGRRTAVAVAAGLAIIALTLPWSINRGEKMVSQVQDATASGTYQHDLFAAVDRLGGKQKLFVCPPSYVAINHTAASMLAWKLKVKLVRVHPLMVSQGYVFVGPHVSDLGHPPPILSEHVDRVRLVTTSGAWKVYAVSRAVTSQYGLAGSLCPGHV